MMLYICTKFCESISKDFRVTDPKSRVAARVIAIYEGHYHIKAVGGVTVLVL